MNKTNEYFMSENYKKKQALLFLPFHNKPFRCYRGKSTSLGSWMPS